MSKHNQSAQYDISEFINGQRDCKDGVPHKEGSESYNAGYSAEYELQQINDYRSLKNGHQSTH